MVENSNDVVTILFRCPEKSKQDAIELTAADAQLVTATSAVSHENVVASLDRTCSWIPTHVSHSDPNSSRPSRYALYAPRTSSAKAPCEQLLT